MLQLLKFLWQLPQNLLGLGLLLFYKHEKQYHSLNGVRFYSTSEMISGISLGDIVIMNRDDMFEGLHHEYGHHIQSLILGPLYLLIIGLPSLTFNIISTQCHTHTNGWHARRALIWYYNLPWEKWADKLGGVDRLAYINKYYPA